jgi:hypothetical protein
MAPMPNDASRKKRLATKHRNSSKKLEEGFHLRAACSMPGLYCEYDLEFIENGVVSG